MAPDKDNSFRPDLIGDLNSAENITPSGEFLQPVEGLPEAISQEEVPNFTEPEKPAIDPVIFTENDQVQQVEPSQTIIYPTIPTDPMSAYFDLIQGGQSPHNSVDVLNHIRKSA
ncbi:hypothetical protein KJ836_02900 [Patescibacteria group bacterium]|nr:hypothetical protein [Patescibacteria group bacterium]